MAKDTNMSRCPGVASGCNYSRYGSVILSKKFLTNYGFCLQYDVDLTGFSLSKEEIGRVSSSVCKLLKSLINLHIAEKAYDDAQPELFDGLRESK